RRRLDIEDPDATAGRVIRAMVVFDHRPPRLERPHRERVTLEVGLRVAEHFVRVPVVVQQRIARVDLQHRVELVVGRLETHVTRRTALLALGDDVAFLWIELAHTVCATAAAASAAAMLACALGSAALIKASGTSMPIILHCSFANCWSVAMCSACRCPNRPCSFRYSDTGRMLCGRNE